MFNRFFTISNIFFEIYNVHRCFFNVFHLHQSSIYKTFYYFSEIELNIIITKITTDFFLYSTILTHKSSSIKICFSLSKRFFRKFRLQLHFNFNYLNCKFFRTIFNYYNRFKRFVFFQIYTHHYDLWIRFNFSKRFIKRRCLLTSIKNRCYRVSIDQDEKKNWWKNDELFDENATIESEINLKKSVLAIQFNINCRKLN